MFQAFPPAAAGGTPTAGNQPSSSSSSDPLLAVAALLEKQPLPPVGQPLSGGALDDEALDFGDFEWDFNHGHDDVTGGALRGGEGGASQGSVRIHDNKRTRRKEMGRQRYLERTNRSEEGEGDWVPADAFGPPNGDDDDNEDADAAARVAGLLAALPEKVSMELTEVLEANEYVFLHKSRSTSLFYKQLSTEPSQPPIPFFIFLPLRY
jgi:hypothetical protein